MTTNIKLKPCPFCGNIPKIRTKNPDNDKTYYKVICENPTCIKNRQWNLNENEAVAGWNIRQNNF